LSQEGCAQGFRGSGEVPVGEKGVNGADTQGNTKNQANSPALNELNKVGSLLRHGVDSWGSNVRIGVCFTDSLFSFSHHLVLGNFLVFLPGGDYAHQGLHGTVRLFLICSVLSSPAHYQGGFVLKRVVFCLRENAFQ
jgi:hypothetical protein